MATMRELGVWQFTDGTGKKVTVRAEIDDGSKLQRAVMRLANRARGNQNKAAGAMGGAVRVVILSDEEKSE